MQWALETSEMVAYFPNLNGETIDSTELSESVNNCTSLEREEKSYLPGFLGQKEFVTYI